MESDHSFWSLACESFLTESHKTGYLLGIIFGSWGINAPVSEVLNRDVFSRLQHATATQPGVLAELCREYVVEARSTISQLRNALAQGNAADVRERAHYLKGSSMMLGAQQLSQTCATLELMGRDSNLATAAPVLEQAMTSLREVEMVLKEVVGPTALPAEGSAA